MKKKEFRHIKVALVDLTKDVMKPEFAASFDHRLQVYVASIAKIAPMLAAFQLRQDLRAVLKKQHKVAKDINDLFNLVGKDWADTQHDPGKVMPTPFTDGVSLRGTLVLVHGRKIDLSEPKAPRLDRVFADVPAGNPVNIEFSSTGENFGQLKTIVDGFNGGVAGARQKLDALGFLERMGIMVGGDIPVSNYATSTIVRDVGYLYIASTLLESGLYDTNRKGGLWFRDPLNIIAPPWSATAGSLAAFMTLLVQKRLVSPIASGEMRLLMQKRPNLTYPGTGSWFWKGLHDKHGSPETVLAKVGLGGGSHDLAYIEREVDIGGGKKIPLCYIAVGLRAKRGSELQQLILELDKCILANNGLTRAQGGYRP